MHSCRRPVPDQHRLHRLACATAGLLLAQLFILSPPASAGLIEIRSYNGTENNAANNSWGSAGTRLLRMPLAPADYPGDGTGSSMIGGMDRANPRTISNRIAAQSNDTTINARGMTSFVWQWGQFIDHDMDLTRPDAANGTADIQIIDPLDPFYPGPIPFQRSDFVLDQTGTRQQVNGITAYIDASGVYGSDKATAESLRTFDGGELKTSAGNLLPLNPADGAFLAGDERAMEQIGLTSMHTLFMREHNRLAGELRTKAGLTNDEEIYQTARKIVGAELQAITYYEFLPALLGSMAPDPTGFSYDPGIDPSITNEFSGALFRLGHSMLPSGFELLDQDGRNVGELPLRDAFFNPGLLTDDPVLMDRILQGFAVQQASEIDNMVVDDVRNFLFGTPATGGLDLASLNIQRARDHGLPDYNRLREAYGLDAVTGLDQISSDPLVRSALLELYGGVGNIDPWVGGLAEDQVAGAGVGELIALSLIDQFTRLAIGDRFFFLWDPDILSNGAINAVMDFDQLTLAELLRWNTGIGPVQRNVFMVPAPATILLALPLIMVLLVRSRRMCKQ